ncbi:MAG: 23S rRNA (guanosine(2251)-2'-O)-methyltransferase RlmB [Acidobacteria bacterium]|nr:MAG: 23S rRNA (guanosine(2251)-2'-O)-methyltransferase RlmB [Acidobacteriota bacterium]
MLVYGVNPVLEALRARRVQELRISDRAMSDRIREVMRAALDAAVPVRRVPPAALDRMARGRAHQGVAAELVEVARIDVQTLVDSAAGVPLIVVLDGIEDPQNLGAILRTVDACGADGVVRQTRRAAALGGAAAKASAGAVSHVRIAEVVNIARALEELKEAGVWTVGLATDSTAQYDRLDLTLPTAFVLGAEHGGLRRLVRERCDWVVSIPMRGHVQSLNVAVAAGVVLYEAIRQRQGAGKA